MKKLLSLLLALVMVFSLVACNTNPNAASNPSPAGNGSPASPAPDDQSISDKSGDLDATMSEDGYLRDEVTIAVSNDGKSFSPTARGGFGSVYLPLFENLVTTDSAGNVRLVLLKSYEKVDDTTYNLEIWDCIYDSEGNHITAEDVRWSIIDQYVGSGNSGGVNKLDLNRDDQGLVVTGEYTLTWYCSTPFTAGELAKNFSNPKIYSQKAWEDSGADEMTNHPVATGPYKLENYEPGATITLVANENYWMNNVTDQAWLDANRYVTSYQNVERIILKVIPDAGSRAIALENGDVDVCDSMNAIDVDRYASDPNSGIVPVELPQDPPVLFTFNCNPVSVTSDINLRKAILYALDNAGIAAGLSVPGVPSYGIHPRMYDAPEDWTTGREYYDYNLDTAKEYLAQSSYNDETLTILYNNSTGIADAVVMVQAALTAIGVKSELLPGDMAIMNSYRTDYTKWNMLFEISGGGNYLSAVIKKWYTPLANTGDNKQQMGIVDDKLDELYEAIVASETDTGASEEAVAAWDTYFNEMAYGYAICNFSNLTASRDYVNVVLVGAQHNPCPNAFTFND